MDVLKKESRSIFASSVLMVSTLLFCAGISHASETAVSEVKKVSVMIDGGPLAKTIHSVVIPKTANQQDEPPFMNGEPEHLRVTFDDDKFKDYDSELHRQLLVYPLPSYAVLFKGREKIAFDKQLVELKKIITGKSDKGAKEIPMLPAAEAYQVFHNHVVFLPFKQGNGVAFLTSYAQDEAPIGNRDFFYTYQGISADGKFFLSLTYPVKAKNLPLKAPVKTGIAYLGKLPSQQFTPSLVELDKLIKSITLK